MRDDMIFLADPHPADLRLAQPEPPSPSLSGFNVQSRLIRI